MLRGLHIWVTRGGAAIQVTAATLFLLTGIVVIGYNLRELVKNPLLGTNQVFTGRRALVEGIEGISNPTKEQWINLNAGDGMRLIHFLAANLPEDVTIVFPRSPEGYADPIEFFDFSVGSIMVRLYPRQFVTEPYDYLTLPLDGKQQDRLVATAQMITREYHWRSRHFMFHLYRLPEARTYRLFFGTRGISGNPDYHTEHLFLIYPEEATR